MSSGSIQRPKTPVPSRRASKPLDFVGRHPPAQVIDVGAQARLIEEHALANPGEQRFSMRGDRRANRSMPDWAPKVSAVSASMSQVRIALPSAGVCHMQAESGARSPSKGWDNAASCVALNSSPMTAAPRPVSETVGSHCLVALQPGAMRSIARVLAGFAGVMAVDPKAAG
jgi:hypothetical protein